MNRVNFYLPDDVLAAVKELSKKENRSMSNWICQIVRAETAKERQSLGIKKHEIN